MITDIKHVFACNPLYPVYREEQIEATRGVPAMRFVRFDDCSCEIREETTAGSP